MTWPYVNYGSFAQSTYAGDQRLIVWTLAWANQAILTGTPLFDANIFFPAAESLRYNEHLSGVSLFTLPWAALGASPVLAHNVTWWLAFPLNGLTAYLLLRRFVADSVGSFLGSLVFTYSFYVMSHAHGHLHLIWLWTIPLSLLLFDRWFGTPTYARATVWAAVLILAILSSWYVAVFALVANGLLALVLMAAAISTGGRLRSSGGLWGRRLSQAALAAALCAASVYPFARHYVGIESSELETAANSADIASYVIPPRNSIHGRWWREHLDERPREIFGEQTLFAGWIALALGVAGLVPVAGLRPRRHTAAAANLAPAGLEARLRASFLPVLTLVAVLLSFGLSLPVVGETPLAPFRLVAALPGLDGMRAPARFAGLAMLGLGGLVALGASKIQQRHGNRGRLLLLALSSLMLLEWRVVDFPAGKPTPHATPAIYRAPEVRSARALVSLPEYSNQPDWFLGADYLYYSMSHWRPIVNGFGRAQPAGHGQIVSDVRAFPDSSPRLRELGVQLVVVHAARFANGPTIVAKALDRSDCRLMAQVGSDYLFELVSR